MELYSTKALARDKLPGNLSEAATERLMERIGVKPFEFGRGRGLGNWWDWEEVQVALKKYRDGEPKATPKKPRRRKSAALASSYFDGSAPTLTSDNGLQ